MRRRARLTVGLVLAVGLAGCALRRETPQVRYYTLAVEQPEHLGAPATVLAFTIDPPYRDVRLAYRASPYQLDYYTYHRWAAPPRQLLTSIVRDYFGSHDAADTPRIEITGHIRRFEEVDGKDGWSGALTVALTASQAGIRLVDATYAEVEPAERKEPEAVVAALSRALGRILERFAADVTDAARPPP